ncbi:hypothetical protein [Desulfosporosinus youngiae]|uniref:Flagellar hook-length control protein FliK n=1 Tax=Desulfosporosinus youngiae DSM 17734 TaxID=768710 RepID=H5XVR4_9FIRM|nr:hypothetical protein [Desulfosporosinus youngiae]EHQ90220.1 hypothetical protein DesyoDRAFT_3188 [Desulfosporosinus youngiae DSM 17734]
MEVGGISAPGSVNQNLQLNKFKLGERLLIEIIHKTSEGEGTIRTRGQTMLALIETSTKAGEKFWARVASLNEGGLLLVREPLPGKPGEVSAPQQFQALTERGLPNNPEIIALLKSFPAAKMGVLSSLLGSMPGSLLTDELLKNLRKAIPQWNSLAEENGVDKLLASLKKLGLNYEQRLQQMLKLDHPAKEIEKNSLKDTFKGRLLEAIQRQEDQGFSDSDSPLAGLLQKITGQQLWFKTGAMDNAYMLLHFLLFDQERFVPVQIAIESARKGLKMDEEHCRIAVLVETEELGELGIDAFFTEDSLSCRVLSHDLSDLPQLLDMVIPETRKRFAQMGFTLGNVEVGELEQNLEFQKFLLGSRRSGVDISR